MYQILPIRKVFNRYSYVNNNPLRFIDPTGHFTEEELIDWGAYTAEELKWLAEHQANWHNHLMQAAVGDAFAFAREWATGVGEFWLGDDGTLLIAGASWTGASGVQIGPSSIREWGDIVGAAAIKALGILEPEERLYSALPNPHIHLSGKAAETNAQVVLGLDMASTGLTLAGYTIILLDTLAMPMDPAGKAFGAAVTNVGSVVSTLSLLDTLATSGPNSRGFAFGAVTNALGWSSLILNAPVDLSAAGVQLGYDYYAWERVKMMNRR